MTKKNKITVEIDIDEFLSAKDRQDALYKAVYQVVNGGGFMIGIEERLTKRLLSDAVNSNLVKAFDEQVLATYTKEKIQTLVEQNAHGITGDIRTLMATSVAKIEVDVTKSMKSKVFIKKITDGIQTGIISRLRSLVVNDPYEGDHDY